MTSSMLRSNSRRAFGSAVAALGAALLVHACATPRGGAVEALIHPPVSVQVVAFGAECPQFWTCWTKANWTVRISEEPINIENDSGPVEINWVIVSDDWVFDKKGIDFRDNSMWLPKEVNEKDWKATSKNRKGQVYKYMLNLKRKSTEEPLSWDPTVMN